jgi:hypothetical protein
MLITIRTMEPSGEAPMQSGGIVPKIDSIVAVTSIGVRLAVVIASMIRWFIGHGHSGVVVKVPSTYW